MRFKERPYERDAKRHPYRSSWRILINSNSVNDKHGHLAGDVVLREVARRILASVRTYDSVGRYGGEEFLIVAPGCSRPEAVQLAERLRLCVGDVAINANDFDIPVTMSLGVADVSAAQDADELLRSADDALYTAKKTGRNRVGVSPNLMIPIS